MHIDTSLSNIKYCKSSGSDGIWCTLLVYSSIQVISFGLLLSGIHKLLCCQLDAVCGCVQVHQVNAFNMISSVIKILQYSAHHNAKGCEYAATNSLWVITFKLKRASAYFETLTTINFVASFIHCSLLKQSNHRRYSIPYDAYRVANCEWHQNVWEIITVWLSHTSG